VLLSYSTLTRTVYIYCHPTVFIHSHRQAFITLWGIIRSIPCRHQSVSCVINHRVILHHCTTVIKCVATKMFLLCLKNYSRLATNFPYTSTITVTVGFLVKKLYAMLILLLFNFHNINLTNGVNVRYRNRNTWRHYKHF
jgi:hypothetical protein